MNKHNILQGKTHLHKLIKLFKGNCQLRLTFHYFIQVSFTIVKSFLPPARMNLSSLQEC